MANCVRVYYAEEDDYKHHIDFPIYRQYERDAKIVRELASAEGWVESNPTQVTVWFEGKIIIQNELVAGSGSQLRRTIRLVKRFCRSRYAWDMPNGLKLMMLTIECFQATERDDEAFYWLLVRLKNRLAGNLEIENLADTNFPHKKLTNTSADDNVVFLRTQINEALGKLSVLHSVNCTKKEARDAWDWLFQSEGFFAEFDESTEARKADLRAKAELINASRALTSPTGIISVLGGVSNRPHAFHGGTIGKASKIFRKGKVTAQEQTIFSIQAQRIRRYFSTFRCLSKKNILKCFGTIRPTEYSPTYSIEIDYPMGGIPHVTIKDPSIIAKARTHVYKEGCLCLYDPQQTPWRGTNNLHETIIPWIAEWIVFYELYLIEGKWLGPEASH